MKNYKLPLMGFAIVLSVISCRKEDIQQNSLKITSTSTAAGSWKSFTNWSTVKANDSITTSFSQVSDTAINSAVANSGLVLVFKKVGSSIQALPYQDKSDGTYWYYQISKGFLRINGNNNAIQHNSDGQTFSYFIFTPEKIAALKEKGKTAIDLMQLTYEQALALFK